MLGTVSRFSAVALLWPTLAFAQIVDYYHLDALGNVRVVTDQSKAVVERHDYLPFGEECSTGACASNPGVGAGQPRKFTGKERDTETGLDYFGARYYASRIGRFTTVDPLYTWQENLLDPQRWNRYSYGRNNPLRFVDPDGKAARDMTGAQVAQLQQAAAAAGPSNNGFVLDTLLPAAGLALVAAPVAALGIEFAPALMVEAQIAGGSYLATRAQQVHGAVGGPVTQGKTTVAVARVGTGQTLVASSENALRPAQRALLKAGETAVKGPGHAEMTAINAAKAAGQRVTDVAASRPICADCATAIRATGARIRSAVKEP